MTCKTVGYVGLRTLNGMQNDEVRLGEVKHEKLDLIGLVGKLGPFNVRIQDSG